jgi:serine/threonine protein kinase
MAFPFDQIQSTMKSLVYGSSAGRKPGKKADSSSMVTIINGRYRIDEPVKARGTRGLYTATPVRGGETCHVCGLQAKEMNPPFCLRCGANLRGKMLQTEIVPGRMDPKLIQRLYEISHPCIAQIFDIFPIGANTYVISDGTPGVTLDRLEGMLTAQQLRIIGINLTQTVEFLHGQGICHMDLQPSNLKLVGDSPRLLSLTASCLRGSLSRKELDRFDREDFIRILETLEKLAAEHGVQLEGDRLCRLLVAFQDLLGKDQLTSGEIQEALALS